MAFDLATARPAEEVEQPAAAPPPPKPRFDVATAKPVSYMDDYLGGIKDAATAPGGGPTGIGLVDAAAGVADFAASAAWDTLTAVPRLATQAFVGARGGQAPPDLFTRTPTTPVGSAIQNTLGAALRPVGDALGATGLPAPVSQFLVEAGGTALDVMGLKGAARGARPVARLAGQGDFTPPPGPARPRTAAELGEGVEAIPHPVTGGGQPLGAERAALFSVQRQVGTEPTPVTNPRPFGQAVERARRLDFRVLPSQVAGRAQAEAPIGKFGLGHDVPGTFREGFTANDLVPQAVIDNSKRVDSYAAKELGISQVTEQGLALAKNPHNAAFNEVARVRPVIVRDPELKAAANALGAARRDNPYLRNTAEVERVRDRLLSAESAPTQKVLDAIREYRKDARTLFQKQGDVEAEQAAFAYRDAANALEAALERQAGAVDSTLIPRLRNARIALAKIHNVEDAFDGMHVDPQKIRKLGEKYELTGYLGDIAQVARDFPETMQSATGVSLPSQSQIGSIWSPHLFARRALGKEQGPMLLRDDFQQRFGIADPNYDPRPGPSPDTAPPTGPFPPGNAQPPGGPQWPSGQPPIADELLPSLDDLGTDTGWRPTDFPEPAVPPSTMPDAFEPGVPWQGRQRAMMDQADAGMAGLDDLEALLTPQSVPPLEDLAAQLGIDLNAPEIAGLLPAPSLDVSGIRVPGAAGVREQYRDLGLTPGTREAQMQHPGRPLPPDDLAGELVEPQGPPPAPPAPLGLADELTAEPPPVLDLAEARGARPELSAADVRPLEGTKLKIRDNAPANLLRDRSIPENATVIFEGPDDNPARWIVLEPRGDALVLRSIDTTRYKAETPRGQRTGPPGQELYVQAAKVAEERGLRFDSDSDMSKDAVQALENAILDGRLVADNWDEVRGQLWAAIAEGGGKASRKSGEPWVKGIRLGPAG